MTKKLTEKIIEVLNQVEWDKLLGEPEQTEPPDPTQTVSVDTKLLTLRNNFSREILD